MFEGWTIFWALANPKSAPKEKLAARVEEFIVAIGPDLKLQRYVFERLQMAMTQIQVALMWRVVWSSPLAWPAAAMLLVVFAAMIVYVVVRAMLAPPVPSLAWQLARSVEIHATAVGERAKAPSTTASVLSPATAGAPDALDVITYERRPSTLTKFVTTFPRQPDAMAMAFHRAKELSDRATHESGSFGIAAAGG